MNKVKTFLLTTLLVGTLSGTASIIQFLLNGKKNPLLIFKFISSGYFGKKAFFKGDIMAFYGIAFHYLIAGIWVMFFFFMFPKLKFTTNSLLAAVAFGIITWLCMYLIVIPYSNAPKVQGDPIQAMISISISILTVGLPIAIIQKKL